MYNANKEIKVDKLSQILAGLKEAGIKAAKDKNGSLKVLAGRMPRKGGGPRGSSLPQRVNRDVDLPPALHSFIDGLFSIDSIATTQYGYAVEIDSEELSKDELKKLIAHKNFVNVSVALPGGNPHSLTLHFTDAGL
jgi:hypothetical protein